jgi:O-antigen/teichoic acid export membrane protein
VADSERLVGKNFLVLGGGDALARAIAFFATAYLTRVLGAGGYGVVALGAAVTLYLSQLAHFGIDTLGIREVAEDRGKIDRLVPAILSARIAWTALLSAVVAAIGMVAIPAPEGPVIAAFALALIPQAATAKWVLLGLESAVPIGIARIAGEVTMVAAILSLVRSAADLWAVPAASIAGESATAVLMLIALRRRGFRMPLLWSPSEVKPIFARAWPIVGHALLGLMIYNSDLIFLRFFESSTEVGLYAAAYALISFVLNLGGAYSTSLLPTLTRLRHDHTEELALYQTAHAQVFAASLPIALGGGLLAEPLLARVFGAEYQIAALPLAILIASVPFSLSRSVAIAGLVARDRSDRLLRTTFVSAVINTIANVLLIPRWGMAGAALATLLTEVLRSILAIGYASQVGLHFTSLLRHWRACVAGAAMVGALQLLRPYDIWHVAPGALAYVLALFAVGGIRFAGRRPVLQV